MNPFNTSLLSLMLLICMHCHVGINGMLVKSTDRETFYNQEAHHISEVAKRSPKEFVPSKLSSNHQRGIFPAQRNKRSKNRRLLDILLNNPGVPATNFNNNHPQSTKNEMNNPVVDKCVKVLDVQETNSLFKKEELKQDILCFNFLQCLLNSYLYHFDYSEITEKEYDLAKTLTIEFIPECGQYKHEKEMNYFLHDNNDEYDHVEDNSDYYQEAIKRAPFAGAERRYDNLLSILNSRLSKPKKSFPMANFNLRKQRYNDDEADTPYATERKDENIPSFNSFKRSHIPLHRDNVDFRLDRGAMNKLKDGYFDDAMDFEKKHQFSLGIDLNKDDRPVRATRKKREPEVMEQTPGNLEDFTDGTLGNYAAGKALDAYVTLLHARRDIRDVSDTSHLNSKARSFVG